MSRVLGRVHGDDLVTQGNLLPPPLDDFDEAFPFCGGRQLHEWAEGSDHGREVVVVSVDAEDLFDSGEKKYSVVGLAYEGPLLAQGYVGGGISDDVGSVKKSLSRMFMSILGFFPSERKDGAGMPDSAELGDPRGSMRPSRDLRYRLPGRGTTSQGAGSSRSSKRSKKHRTFAERCRRVG